MWIIKLGGSWISNPDLKKLLFLLRKHSNQNIVIVVGGGIFADAVRYSQKYLQFDDLFANNSAIQATENFAKALHEVYPFLKITSKFSELDDNSLKIWLPFKHLNKNNKFIKNWESTSDSIACWLATKINCKKILFIKSINYLNKNNYNLNTLQKKGILDKNLLLYLNKECLLKIVGPELINILKKNKKWSDAMDKINDIIYERS
mgnify:CR=1 FL=1|tara:strand:- start:853 stop:1467 length:615 start_codon:yes stop_codon:yes gene_type:complete